ISSALLFECSSAVQMMENLFDLKSVIETWLTSSQTSWVVDTILAFLCGLGIFLLLLPWILCLRCPPLSGLPSPPGLIHSWLQLLSPISYSHLGRLPDKGSFHLLSCQETPGETCEAVPAGVCQPCGEPVEDAAPAIPPLAPLSKHPPPLASTLLPGPTTSSASVHSHTSLNASQPPEPSVPLASLSPWPLDLSSPPPCPPDSEACPPPPTASSAPTPQDSTPTLTQDDPSMALPLGTVPQNLSPHNPGSTSLAPAISGFGRSGCPPSALSRWQAAAKALCLSRSSQGKSQEKHLSYHPPDASFSVGPSDREMEASSPSLLSSDDQKLLEIQMTKTVEIKIWKEKEKDGSNLKQMSPDCHLDSLGSMLKALGADQNTTIAQTFWNTKDKPEQLPCPQQLSYPNHLQQEYNQLFWGLPSLHSESLVATAWISESPSAPQSPSFLFNRIPNASPVQMQAKIFPLLSQFQPLSRLEFQSQPFIPTIPQFQLTPLAQVQTQAPLKPSLPIETHSSPPQIRACGIRCPLAPNKPQSLTPTEIPHSEQSLLLKQLENAWDLSSEVKRSQEVSSVFTSKFPEDSWVGSILPENFPISPELRKQLEQHLQKWLIQHRWELPQRIQESLEISQLQEEFPRTRQAKAKHGPSRPSSFIGESSKDAQKVGFRRSQDLGKGLGHILGKVPKDLSGSSESSLVKFQEENPEESESDLSLLKNDLGINLLRSLDKDLEKILKGHLVRKLGKVAKDLIPRDVNQSRLTVSHASLKSDTHMETRNLGILKSWAPCVNTSHRVSFLDPDTRDGLEAHIIRFRVKHRWGLPLKVLKPINLFKLKKAQPSPIRQFSFCPSATYVSEARSTVRFAEFLGKPPQAHSRERVITKESAPTLVRSLLGPSPVSEEAQRVLGRIPASEYHGPSKASLTGREARPPSRSLTVSLMGRTWKTNLGMQSLRAEEAREAVEPKESSALKPQSRVILGTKMLTKCQTTNVHMTSLRAPGTSKISLLPRMSAFQHPGEPCLNTEVAHEFKSKVKLQSDNQLQGCPKHMFLAAKNLSSRVSQYPPPKVPTGDRLASQALSGPMAAPRSRLGQQEPQTSKLQDSWKSQSKMIATISKRRDCRGPKPGEHEESFKELGTSQAGNMSHPAQGRGIIGSKKQGPPESPFRKRMRLLFEWIFPSKKVKSQDALQKGKPVSAITESQGPIKSKSILKSETAEAQALMTAVGHILEEKMAIHHGHHATKLNDHRQELQASVCGCSCYHKFLFYPEQGKMVGYRACSHQANFKDQSCSFREREVRHQQSSKSVRFNDEPTGLRQPPTLSPKKTLSPVSPCQHGSRMPGALARHQHCPRHCCLRGGVLPSKP
uniref:Uncharacterized protein n=1 Tax=Sus scrofa TaxID=9823 RepID=A0A4X1W6Z4_PIG